MNEIRAVTVHRFLDGQSIAGCSRRGDDLPGVQDVQRVPRRLEPAHQIDGRVSELLVVLPEERQVEVPSGGQVVVKIELRP